jgi:NADH-quinone oxidoreductase subunit G
MSETAKPTAAPATPPPAAAPAAPPAPQFAPAPEGFVNVLVDGKHAVVPKGDNLIDAAKKVNVEIPYFCYHPRLSIAGQCRMCLVETSDMPGRLVAGCQVRVKEGLKIITNTPPIKENQRAVMEFHLINHPVDCPICDQSGECKLQDYYVQFDAKGSRLQTHKVAKPKRKDLGPLVVYDGERCILCTRCVRFMNEVAEEPQIAMVGRGDHSEIDTVPGMQLDSQYAGNTVDICPVGALLNRDFRFTSRVWYLDSERSVCDGCANGCNIAADVRADSVYRYLPKRNEEVNQVWLCDDGRLSYHRTMDNRVRMSRQGRGDALANVSTDAVVASAAAALKGKGDLAVAISAALSTEEAFAAALFAKEVLGAKKLFATGRAAGKGDDFLIREDKNPNANGLKLVAQAVGLDLGTADELVAAAGGKVKHLLAFGAELPGDEAKASAALAKLDTFVLAAVTDGAVAEQATHVLPLATHLEQDGTFVNYYGRLQRFRRTIEPRFGSLPAWAWVTRLSKALGSPWAFDSAGEAFGVLASKAPALKGLSLAGLPDTGVTLPGFAPKAFGKRAPRPANLTNL